MSQHSVLDSSIEVSQSGNYTIVSKVTRLHPDFENMSEEIFSLICKYIEKLQLAGIIIPQIITSGFDQGKIMFQCVYAGENIVEMVRSNNIKNTLLNTDIFDQMFVIIEKAQNAKIYFDPHKRLIKRGLINKGYDEFITRAESVIEKERRREKNNIYLL